MDGVLVRPKVILTDDGPARELFLLRRLQIKRLCHSSGQLIHRHRGVNIDGLQFQTLCFLVKTMSEHGVALEQVAESPLGVACFSDKSPLRSTTTIDHCLAKLGSRKQPDSVITHGEERLYEV